MFFVKNIPLIIIYSVIISICIMIRRNEMETKIKKWSRNLKWLLVSAMVWYGIGFVVQLPDFLAPENWTIECATRDIIEELDKYIDTQESAIILRTDAVKQYLRQQSYYLCGRVAEIIFNMAIFMIGFVITRRLSKQVVFDNYICSRTRWMGIIICISSIVIPTLGRQHSSLVILGGFGLDIVADWYRLGCGVAVMLLAHLLQRGQFLQEEYDTTL